MACIVKDYFKTYLSSTGANSFVWASGLMASEAYILEVITAGWIINETDNDIIECTAQAYNNHTKVWG